MKFSLSVIMFSLFLSASMFAQEKIHIGVAPFEDGYNSRGYSKKVTNIMLDIFQKNERFKVIDLSNQDVVAKERERQKDESFIDGYIVDQGRSQGSSIIATGSINSVHANYDHETKRYSGFFEITIKLFDVEENTVIASTIINQNGRQNPNGNGTSTFLKDLKSIVDFSTGSSTASTEEEAISSTMMSVLPKQVNAFVRNYFPVELPVQQIDKKGKKYYVLIIGNEGTGLMAKTRMELYYKIPKEIGGKTLYMDKVLGEVKIENFLGDFIELKVLKNGENMFKIYSEQKHKLLVREK